MSKRRDGKPDRVEVAGADRGEQRRAFHELVAGERVEAAHRYPADMVLGASDPLQKRGDAPRRPQLAHELDGADVDAELERSRCDDCPELPGPETLLHPEPALHRKAPVVGLDAVLPEPLCELVRDSLGHPPRVDEHERRPVLLDVRGDLLEHRGHLLDGRHRTELVVGKLDGDVERPSVADVDDDAARLTVGQSAVRPGPHEEPGDRGYRPLGGRQADPDRPAAGRRRFGRGGGPVAIVCVPGHATGRPDQTVEPLQAEGEVGTSFVPGEGVDLVDDHGPHRAEHLPAACRCEEEVERLRRRDYDLRPVADHCRPLGRRRVPVTDRDLHIRRFEPKVPRDLGDLGEGLAEILAHVDGERSQRRDVHDVGAPSGFPGLGRPVAAIDRHQERRQCLARSGGRGDQRVDSRSDGLPTGGLRLRRPVRITPPEPLGHGRVKAVEGGVLAKGLAGLISCSHGSG